MIANNTRTSYNEPILRGKGYGRYHYRENIQFCRQARGSLFELLDHFSVAKDEGYMEDKELLDIREEVLNLIRILNGYINYLDREKRTKE